MSLQERTLVVRGFDPDKTTPAILKELCLQGGPVRNVVVKPDHAFVEYEDVESVGYSKALLEGVELFGKKLQMDPKLSRNPAYLKYSKLLHDYIRYDKQQRNQQQQQQQQLQQQQQFQLHQQMLATFNQNREQQAQYINMPQQFEQNPSFPINFVNSHAINSPSNFQQNGADIFSGQNHHVPQVHQQIASHQILPPQIVPTSQQMPPQNQFLQPNYQQMTPPPPPDGNVRRSRSFNHQQYSSRQSNKHRRSNDWVRRK